VRVRGAWNRLLETLDKVESRETDGEVNQSLAAGLPRNVAQGGSVVVESNG
jgi:hypothetical protein